MSKTQTTNTADKIATFKNVYSSMPANNKRSDNTIFEHFSGFFYSYLSFTKADDESTKASFGRKCNYHMEKLWASIHHEFFNIMWHFNESNFTPLSLNKFGTIETLKPGLRLALSENRNTEFFRAYPYVKDLLFIDEFFLSGTTSKADMLKFFSIISTYQIAIDKYDFLLPILVLKEHII